MTPWFTQQMKMDTNTIFAKSSNNWRLLCWPWHVFSGSGLASLPKHNSCLTILGPCLVLQAACSSFLWNCCTAACPNTKRSSIALKGRLTPAPVLAYPWFDHNAGTFQLQTNASAVGLGTVLEQNGRPVAYASHSLISPEKQDAVIHKGSVLQ